MSATRSLPTIGINQRGIPLSAVTVSLHYLPRCLKAGASTKAGVPKNTEVIQECAPAEG